VLCIGTVDRAADIRESVRLTEVGWRIWDSGCVPAGRLSVRLPRWIGRPKRLAETSELFTARKMGDVSAASFSSHRSGAASSSVWNSGANDTSRGASLRAVRASLHSVRASLEPGVQSGQIAFVLAVFPFSFEYNVAHRLWLDRVLGELEGLPLVAGFWSSSWYTSRLIDGLKQRNVALCLYDAPQGDSSLGDSSCGEESPREVPRGEHMPPAIEVLTADRVYIKLLGRKGNKVSDRAWSEPRCGHAFGYRYTERELAELVPRIMVWTREAKSVGMVFANGRWARESAALLATLAGRLEELEETERRGKTSSIRWDAMPLRDDMPLSAGDRENEDGVRRSAVCTGKALTHTRRVSP